uniref:Centrosomal protein of 131 kDa n=1 Tax=Gouania willdenowi TaxID=441366 RepID=A0A8C5GSE1_GOUWI
MHPTRSPASIPTGDPGHALDLSLSGSRLSVPRRPSSASPGKHFTRSVSVSVACDGRAKRNTLQGDASSTSHRSIKNLRRSNSTTQVNQQANISLCEEQHDDYLTVFDSSSDGRRKLASLRKTSPDRTTWNILDDQPRVLPLHSSSRSISSSDSPTGPKKRDPSIALAATFTANNRSNKGGVGNSVTTILHNNYSEKPLTPKSSNQKPSFNNILKATANDELPVESGSLTKSQKNFSSASPSSSSNNRSPVSAQRCSPVICSPRREATEEEAERFIKQVNQAAVTIQRWYRRQAKTQLANREVLKRILTSKRKERSEDDGRPERQRKDEDRKRIREEKARLARLTAIQELKQKRAHRAEEVQHVAEAQLENVRQAGAVGRRKPPRISLTNKSPASPSNNSPLSPTDTKTKNTGLCRGRVPLGVRLKRQSRSVSVEDQQQQPHGAPSKTTLHELLDTLKLLEEEPQRLSVPKEKHVWVDEVRINDGDSNSLTTDNLERHGQLVHHHVLPDGGALLSEAKLQSIMSFLDEMEKSEQERPRSVTSGSHREAVLSEEELVGIDQASATAAEISGSMMRIRMELEEKKRSVHMLQTALAQQRELTVRHAKETEKELSRSFQLQKEQYEATIQRHLNFIDQLISDKKTLSERCEGVVAELKQVDQKYMKKMSQMQEQHELEIKKLKDLMSATEKIRREKWIDEKTKKIKEITVKGLEPEIQKLISKHKQELKKLRMLHEAELLQADERAAQRYVLQSEELRLQLEKERDEQCQREREHAQHRQRAELEDLRRQLEENSSLAGRALREELDKSREEQERRHQMEMKAMQERLDLEKQSWEENYRKKEEAWLLSRERKMKDELRRDRDKEIELAIWTLEEETTKDREECERAAENRVKRVREKYEAELKELERSERAAVEKHQDLRKQQMESEGEILRLRAALRQKEQEVDVVTQLADERHHLAEVIRQEFADRLVATEEDNRRMKVEASEMRARLRLEVEKVTREKEEELAEVHQRRIHQKIEKILNRNQKHFRPYRKTHIRTTNIQKVISA